MGEKSRLQALLEKQEELAKKIEEEKTREQAEKILNNLGADVATVVTQAASKAKVDIAVLHGKFFALTVDDGKLSVTVATKAKGNGNGNGKATGNGNGNGEYEYFLSDGRGAYETIQQAMEALGIPEANRPKHNRYDRLSADWQTKIIRKAKVEQPANEQQANTEQANTEQANTEQANTEQANTEQANTEQANG